MQALPILPMLMSVLAMAISLLAAIMPGVAGADIIMVLDFAMFSPEHFIIAAEAGETAKAETTAAAIKNLIQTSLGNGTSAWLVEEVRIFPGERFRKETISVLRLT
jgi:hypothetical protein